ncbi:hypothetical protein DES53_104447 [Roseimicrobium gellanilyticum]|uniref:Uncharacterized protein n=1 Tax=Roseimicrobium gellanilyticum TaxID=748857 RepID=A0A366HPU4_9BACT|nr:hypothetical protein [Roseimicrobium gellanilyticum]RBP44625.1 hypothetical protein DES53_104447 [Roseimicrobium gellanilyticum]
MRSPAKITILVLGALVLACVIYKSTVKYRVRCVVSKDFRGVFTIAERAHGTPPKKSANNLWVYNIPKDGTLRTTDASILEEWHTQEAIYADGSKLPSYGMDEGTIDSKGVMLFPLQTSGDRIWYFFVGTKEEYDQASTSPRPPIPE